MYRLLLSLSVRGGEHLFDLYEDMESGHSQETT